jgi:hypothetical protein
MDTSAEVRPVTKVLQVVECNCEPTVKHRPLEFRLPVVNVGRSTIMQHHSQENSSDSCHCKLSSGILPLRTTENDVSWTPAWGSHTLESHPMSYHAG